MSHPYAELPERALWARAVAARGESLDPVVSAPFRIGPEEPVATAGSCFAQHLARHLVSAGFRHLREEAGEGPAFSAAYGNLYTARQARLLLEEAYGLHAPAAPAWRRPDGHWLDALRPRHGAGGFESEAAVLSARATHLAAVRRVAEGCAAFVLTLGLTEAWLGEDGTAYPSAPGVLAEPPAGHAVRFRDLGLDEVRADLGGFLDSLRAVNPGVRVVLTVSPVPLAATAGPEHVLVANAHSKAVLRVAAGEAARGREGVAYFPSYEVITGSAARGRYFAADLRAMTEEGVRAATRLFGRHFLAPGGVPPAAVPPTAAPLPAVALAASEAAAFEADLAVVCEEEALAGLAP